MGQVGDLGTVDFAGMYRKELTPPSKGRYFMLPLTLIPPSGRPQASWERDRFWVCTAWGSKPQARWEIKSTESGLLKTVLNLWQLSCKPR